jgi:hypothetical protein
VKLLTYWYQEYLRWFVLRIESVKPEIYLYYVFTMLRRSIPPLANFHSNWICFYLCNLFWKCGNTFRRTKISVIEMFIHLIHVKAQEDADYAPYPHHALRPDSEWLSYLMLSLGLYRMFRRLSCSVTQRVIFVVKAAKIISSAIPGFIWYFREQQ